MSVNPVFVALSSFGAEEVARRGQIHFMAIVADAGLAGAEIRRELFGPSEPPFSDLRQRATALGLRLFYSTPLALFRPDGSLAADDLRLIGREAAEMGAETVKMALGPAPGHFDRLALGELLADLLPVKLLVENDQSPEGGRAARFAAFFAHAAGLPVAMTFDLGNWSWVDEDMRAAAKLLAQHVAYVHCKTAITGPDGRLRAGAVDTADDAVRQVFAQLPPGLPRAIEYPLTGTDLRAELRRNADQLAQLDGRKGDLS